jgi:hypothetical protein
LGVLQSRWNVDHWHRRYGLQQRVLACVAAIYRPSPRSPAGTGALSHLVRSVVSCGLDYRRRTFRCWEWLNRYRLAGGRRPRHPNRMAAPVGSRASCREGAPITEWSGLTFETTDNLAMFAAGYPGGPPSVGASDRSERAGAGAKQQGALARGLHTGPRRRSLGRAPEIRCADPAIRRSHPPQQRARVSSLF